MKKVTTAISSAAVALLVSSQLAFADTIVLTPPKNVVSSNSVTISSFIGFVINMLIIIAIVASLIFLIYGGIRWIISGGDKEKVETARKTVVSSIIGLVVVLLAWVIITITLQFLGLGGLNNLVVPTLTGK